MGTTLDFTGTNNTTNEKISGFAYAGNDLCTQEDADFARVYACDNPDQPREYKGTTYTNYAQFFQENLNFFSIYDDDAEPNEDGSAKYRTGEWTDITVDAVWMTWFEDDSKITP